MPVLMGSAFKNKGVQEVLDAIALYLPAPTEKEVFANDLSSAVEDGQTNRISLRADPHRPLVAMAFKTVVEPFGQLTYLRGFQGRIERGRTYHNTRTGRAVRFGRLVRIHAGQREEIDSANAGDIVGSFAIECASGDTFVGDGCNVTLENISVADPVMRLAIEPARRDDSDKLAKALDRFRREDPTFRVMVDPATGETLIAGMGQLHLEVYVERAESEFDCPCVVGPPRVTYRSRPTCSVEFDYQLKKQTGGPGQYAKIIGRLEALPEGCEESFVFESQVAGGRISKSYIAAVQEGIVRTLAEGPQNGCEVVGVKVTLIDGDQHENDSSEMSFKTCAGKAMRDEVLPRAGLVMLEPVMELEVEMPQEYMGAVTGYLARKRGVVTSAMTESQITVIGAEVPLVELFCFSSDLRSMTQGNGTFSMQPLAYRPTPNAMQRTLLSQS